MSSPAQGGPSVPKEKEKKRLSRVLTRVKTVFKKSDSKRLSLAAGPATPAAATAPSGETPTAPGTVGAAAGQQDDNVVRIPRSQIFEERAKKLGERFGLEIKPSEWYSTEGHALRVEKPIRMRVRRECENCGSLFHAGKACPQCGSTKYKRRPPKRTEAEREESRKKRAALLKAQAENAPIVPDWNPSAADRKAVLRRPAKTGGQDLVYKKPRQRVRRTCCQCQRLFVAHNKTCPGCQHVRCTDCPREPAKKDKYPFGYPGDEWGARSIPHFECPQCQTIFQAKGGEGTDCPQCRHENCPRVKPRKFEPEPDPEVWKSVQAKLEELKLD